MTRIGGSDRVADLDYPRLSLRGVLAPFAVQNKHEREDPPALSAFCFGSFRSLSSLMLRASDRTVDLILVFRSEDSHA